MARASVGLVAVALLAMAVTRPEPKPPPLAPARPFDAGLPSGRTAVDAVPPSPAAMSALRLGLSPGAPILDLEVSELERDLDRMADLGLNHLRLDFDWSRIERSQGEFDWDRTDRIVDLADQRGIRVHGLLTYTPEWARPDDTSDKHPPSDPARFADFTRSAVERYRPMGIASWEIWNEPNVEDFWEPAADPEAYARLLRAGAAAIRSVDPEAIVVSGGLAPADDDDDELSAETFLRRMYDELGPGLVDAVGVHPYSYPTQPANRSKDWNLFGRLPDLHDIVREAEGRPVPLWLTEFGAPTGTADKAVTEEEQGEIIAEGVQCSVRLDWIGALFIYNLRDRPGGDSDDAEDNFGLLTADGRAKPAGELVAELAGTEPGELVPSPCEGW